MTTIASNRRSMLLGTALAAMAACWGPGTAAAEETLKIGVLGVMSGPAASWGLTNKYCAEATANMYNAKGGVEIGGEKYKIEIVPIDDKNDPKLTVSGAERLTQQDGIRYIIGPNIDTTATACGRWRRRTELSTSPTPSPRTSTRHRPRMRCSA